MTHNPVDERLAMVLSLCFYDIGQSRVGFEQQTFCKQCKCSDLVCHRGCSKWAILGKNYD